MDINQWIDGLEQAKPPNESPLSRDQPHTTRKRRRGSKTSSFLEPFANREDRGIKNQQPVISLSSSSSDTSNAASESTSSLSSSPSSSSSDKKYRRRPRHHTKAEKYNLTSKSKSKSQPKKTRKKEKEKEKKPKHARRKKHKSEAITGLVQTFKAKNVPKDRLTLDPVTKLGLYTKGRSSIPTKGKGLPDLVFSEMRFLQKPESSTKEESNPKSKKKSHKKKRRQTSEKEISRYFDPGGARSHDDKGDQKRHTPPHDTPAVEKGPQSVSPVVPDLLDKPFLGFGSRGTNPPTTSYYSWSEPGRESSARAKRFAPDLEPLAPGQFQSSRARKQGKSVLPQPDVVRYLSEEPAITERHSKNQYEMSEHAREIDQASRPPTKPQTAHKADTEDILLPVSDKHETFAPVAASQADQSAVRSNSTKKDSTVREAALEAPNDDEHYSAEPARPRPTDNRVRKQHSEPWDELLQSCELAARPLMPTYYDEGLARYSAIATQVQRTAATYGHADLRLWRTDVGDFLEHDYLDDTAFVAEHVGWTQPEALEYREKRAPFFEETIDDDFESLDSEIDCELPTENEVAWEEGDAEQHDAVPDHQIEDGEAMDELAMFWQPNRLY